MQKFEIKSKKDMATTGIAMIFGGGFISLFIVTAIIGIPIMLIGAVMLVIAPFYKPKNQPV